MDFRSTGTARLSLLGCRVALARRSRASPASMACKGWTNSNNALEQRLVVGEDTLLHIFLAAVAALTYPPLKRVPAELRHNIRTRRACSLPPCGPLVGEGYRIWPRPLFGLVLRSL